jgi:hypothetical protein
VGTDADADEAQDLLEITAPSDRPIRIHAIFWGQTSHTTSAQIQFSIKRVTGGTSGSGGSTPTARPHDPNDAASTATIEMMNTTQYSGGTQITLHTEVANQLNGWVYMPTPEMQLQLEPSEVGIISMDTTPTNMAIVCTVVYEEL